MMDIEWRRLKDQFSVVGIWTDEASKQRCMEASIASLQKKGCDVFRHTEAYDIERERRLLRTDGWTTEVCKRGEGSSIPADGMFYIPRGTEVG